MLLVLFAILCVSLTTGRVVHDDFIFVSGTEEKPVWPDTYTVKVTKLSLTSNFAEDMIIWRTNVSSRLDSNHGAVKIFTKIDDEEEIYEKYEIHPETDKDENIELVCSDLSHSDDVELELDNVLPDVENIDFEAKGNETVFEEETIRFEYVDRTMELEEVHILWASNSYFVSDEVVIWVPFRYEIKEFNRILGSLTKHEIWEFSEFKIDFDEETEFDYESFGCGEDNKVKVLSDSNAVVKELMFVNPENDHHVDHIFKSFKNKFNRNYAHEEEHKLRKTIFKQNMRLISSTNRQNLGYKLGINQFSDRTPEELKRRTGLLRRLQGKSGNIPFPYRKKSLKKLAEELPKEFDLRHDGLVTPVMDQGDCGSCWAFGTTSAMEGALARSNGGRLMRLSQQALVDCAWGFGPSGCDGGSDDKAYEWMMKYGLPTEEEYGTYQAKDGYCHIKNMTTKFPIRGYTDVTPFSSEALKVALFNNGPLSVSVEVTSKFSAYSSGIFYEKDCGPENLNHEVTLVGYGEQYGELFWIIKNSYGVNWGVDGYMMISARDNNCGVATEPTYIVI